MAIIEHTQGEPIICEKCQQPMRWNEDVRLWWCPRDGSIGRTFALKAGGGRLNIRIQQEKAST